MADSIRNASGRKDAKQLDAGDFAELYRAHVDAVFNYCLFRVGERASAEELTADIFERAWRARERFEPARAAFSTWLFTIARRTVIDRQRQRARRPTEPLPAQQPDGRPSPESQVERAERRRQLRLLLEALPAEQQELIALKFGAGLTNRRIAELLDKSESAVGSALYRVMERLREQWDTAQEEMQHE